MMSSAELHLRIKKNKPAGPLFVTIALMVFLNWWRPLSSACAELTCNSIRHARFSWGEAAIYLRLQQRLLLVDGGYLNRLLIEKPLQLENPLVGHRQFVLSFGFNLLAVVCNALPMVDFARQLVRFSLQSVTYGINS